MEELDREITNYFIEIGRIQGMDETYTRLFAALYLEPDEITLEDLAETTGYSMASVSTKVKLLDTLGFIRKSCRPGSKRIYIYMEKNFAELMKQQIILKHERVISLAKQKLPELIKKHEKTAKTDKDKKKLKIIENYYKDIEKADKILPKIVELLNSA